MFVRIDRKTLRVLETSHHPFRVMTGGDDCQIQTNDAAAVPGAVYDGKNGFAAAPWKTGEEISKNNAAALVRRKAAELKAKGNQIGALNLLLKKGLQP